MHKQIFSVSDLISSNRLAVGDGYRAKNSELSDAGVPFARAGNIKDGFQFTDADNFPVTELKKCGQKVSRTGDVVFTSKGTVGRFAFVTEDTETFVYSPQLCFWRSLDHGFISPRYLYYWMHSREFLSQVSQVADKTDMAAYVSLTDQRQFNFPVPQISDQKAIAHILGTLDDKIELNQKMNQTLEEIAKAIFKSWFIDFDPVRAKAEGRPTGLPPEISDLFPDEFVDSEVGEIPKGWALSTPHDLVSTISDTYPLKTVDNVIFLNTGDIEDGRFLHNNFSPANELPGQAKKSIKRGDILFSEIRPKNKRFALVRFESDKYVVSTKLMVLRTQNNVRPELPYFLLTRTETINQLQHIAENRSGTFPQITFEQLKEIKICSPQNYSDPRNPLGYFTDKVLVPFYSRIDLVIRENKVLSELRDTLLPRLISGELRIPDAQKFLEEAGI